MMAVRAEHSQALRLRGGKLVVSPFLLGLLHQHFGIRGQNHRSEHKTSRSRGRRELAASSRKHASLSAGGAAHRHTRDLPQVPWAQLIKPTASVFRTPFVTTVPAGCARRSPPTRICCVIHPMTLTSCSCWASRSLSSAGTPTASAFSRAPLSSSPTAPRYC